MNTFYKILDWPKVPSQYCITNESILESTYHPAHPVKDYMFYRQYNCNDNTLVELLQPFFEFDITKRIFYQIIKKGISTHKDIGRKIIYNYLLDTGGTDVYTKFYDEDKTTEMFSVNIPVHTWHQMDVSYYHNVVGVETPRVAISIYSPYINDT
jgi:hypothetical protein